MARMGDCVLNEKVMEKARKLFLASKKWGLVHVEAAPKGWYDKGSWIKDFIPQAEIELLKEQEEANDE